MQEKKKTRFALVLLKCSLILLAVIVAAHLILGVLLYSLVFIIAGLTGSPINVPDVLKVYINRINRLNWIAEEYFDDPKEVALCKAIEKQDIGAIDKLIAGGVDINAKGKDGMSFLLWAYPAGEKVFERILHHGADPNYVCTDTAQYGAKGYLPKGRTILVRGIMSNNDPKFKNYVNLLLQHGADPDLGMIPPIFIALETRYNDELLQQLIDAGANLNADGDGGSYPVTEAAVRQRYSALMILLEAGAAYDPSSLSGLNMQRILHRQKTTSMNDDVKKEYQKCINWLEKRGVTFETQLQWHKGVTPPEPFRKFPKKKERQEKTQESDQSGRLPEN